MCIFSKRLQSRLAQPHFAVQRYQAIVQVIKNLLLNKSVHNCISHTQMDIGYFESHSDSHSETNTDS